MRQYPWCALKLGRSTLSRIFAPPCFRFERVSSSLLLARKKLLHTRRHAAPLLFNDAPSSFIPAVRPQSSFRNSSSYIAKTTPTTRTPYVRANPFILANSSPRNDLSLLFDRSYLMYLSSHRFKRRKITTCPTEKHKTQVHNGQGSSFGSDRNLSPPPRKNKRDASIRLLLTPRIERSNCTRETVSTLSRITRRSNQSVDPVHRRGHRIERVWSERNVNTDGWINEDSVARYQARPSR